MKQVFVVSELAAYNESYTAEDKEALIVCATLEGARQWIAEGKPFNGVLPEPKEGFLEGMMRGTREIYVSHTETYSIECINFIEQ